MTEQHANRYDTGPTVAVTSGSLKGAWNNGVFVGDPELVEWAKTRAEFHNTVRVFGLDLECDADTPLGALAALSSWSPGRTIVIEAPNEIIDALASSRGSLEIPEDFDDSQEDN